MLNISKETHPNLYKDYKEGLNYLSQIKYEDYEYPESPVIFHIYTDLKTDKEVECVKSFIATQNLEKTKLMIWSDYDISDHPIITKYKKFVETKVFKREEEAVGTPLENHPVWIKGNIFDYKHYMLSGLLRFLVTYKYGGVWADMDMVFLRDFKPILDQEWAYMWGSSLDFENHGPCAAMMNFKKQSALSELCIYEICSTAFQPDSTALDHQLLAKVYRKKPFTVFPSTFFNTEWLMDRTPDGAKLRNIIGTFFESINTNEDVLFLDAFAWHWHHSSHKNKKIETNSKFQMLQARTEKELLNKGLL